MTTIRNTDFVTQLKSYLESFEIGLDEISLVLGPRIEEEQQRVDVLCNVRVIDGEYAGQYEVDATYTFTDHDTQYVLEDIYPSLIDRVRQEFPEARITHYDPDQADSL